MAHLIAKSPPLLLSLSRGYTIGCNTIQIYNIFALVIDTPIFR